MAKNYDNAKCFVKSENGFDEISYKELLYRVDTNPIYAEKKFIPLHGMLMEVSQKEYAEFYKKRRRQKYLRELSSDKAKLPTHVPISGKGLSKSSIVLLEQIRTIDKCRISEYIGRLDNENMKRVDKAIETSLDVGKLEALKNG